jgi:predicted aspartyl protease
VTPRAARAIDGHRPTRWLIASLISLAVGTMAPHGATACDMRAAAETTARFAGGAILVPVRVNGAAAEMILDTASSFSLLDSEAAKPFSLEADPGRRTKLTGVGGETTSPNVIVHSLAVGGLVWNSVSLPIGRIAHTFNGPAPVVGVFGADRLGDFDVELDVPDGRVTFWRVADCHGDFPRWEMPHYALPLQRYPGNFMVAEIELNGPMVRAVIDWGAERTVVADSAAARVGITEEMLARDWTVTGWGVDQKRFPVHMHRFDTMRIGGESFRQVVVPVADIHPGPGNMLLGADFARARRIWLSYATDRMFVAPLNAAGTLMP